MASSSSTECLCCQCSQKETHLEEKKLFETIFCQLKICKTIQDKLFQDGLELSTIPFLTLETLNEHGVPKLKALKLIKELNNVSDLFKTGQVDEFSACIEKISGISYIELSHDTVLPSSFLTASESSRMRVSVYTHTWSPHRSQSSDHHYVSLSLHNTCRDTDFVVSGIKIDIVSIGPYKEPDYQIRGPEIPPEFVSHHCCFLTDNTEYAVLYSLHRNRNEQRTIHSRKKTVIPFGFQADKPGCYNVIFTIFFGASTSISTDSFVQSKTSDALIFY